MIEPSLHFQGSLWYPIRLNHERPPTTRQARQPKALRWDDNRTRWQGFVGYDARRPGTSSARILMTTGELLYHIVGMGPIDESVTWMQASQV